MSTVLLDAYTQAVSQKKIHFDQKQWGTLQALQDIYDKFVLRDSKHYWFSKPFIPGVYLYGHVGTGKTFLMDLFYNLLPTKRKMRMHFHVFMKMVHDKLKELEGHKNPLDLLASEMAKDVDVICFDEFFVENIVDAMLLGNLLQALYNQTITFLTTSNVYPDELYKNGLQRERFIPAIELLKKNNTLFNVDSGIDYRQEKFDYDRAYFHPESAEMEEILLSRFKELAHSPIEYQKMMTLNDRPIQTRYLGKEAVWFDFLSLCKIPRSQLDYLTLSKLYPYLFLSQLRPIQKNESDLIVNFINLIDVFYDAHIRLFICATVPMSDIYQEKAHEFAFERTKSRLIEMQSPDYLNADAFK